MNISKSVLENVLANIHHMHGVDLNGVYGDRSNGLSHSDAVARVIDYTNIRLHNLHGLSLLYSSLTVTIESGLILAVSRIVDLIDSADSELIARQHEFIERLDAQNEQTAVTARLESHEAAVVGVQDNQIIDDIDLMSPEFHFSPELYNDQPDYKPVPLHNLPFTARALRSLHSNNFWFVHCCAHSNKYSLFTAGIDKRTVEELRCVLDEVGFSSVAGLYA